MLSVLLAAVLPFQVVLSQNPQPWEKTAEQELGEFLSRRVSRELTVGGEKGIVFHVGDTALAAEKGILSSKLPDEQWVIRSFGKDIVLNGGGNHGALYAVYHFLEDFCDIRFWSEVDIDVPESETLELSKLDASGRPVFRYRDIHRNGGVPIGRQAFRRRLNRSGDASIGGRTFGGTFDYGPPYHCHTFWQYLSYEKYGKEHPEYFALVKGKRVGGNRKGDLCLSNPDLFGIFREQLWKFVAKGDTWGAKMYEISQNDESHPCECANCQAEVAKYGYSGFYLNFVNRLADELKAKRPALYISTLLYHSTVDLPKGGVRPRDNVIVKLCDTESNQIAPITAPNSGRFRALVDGWGEIAKNIIVWDYAPMFQNPLCFFAFPSEFAFPTDYRYWHEHNVFGVFQEPGWPDLGDFWRIKYYLNSRLWEDPYQDADALVKDAYRHYFGAAWEKIYAARRHIFEKANGGGAFVIYAPHLTTNYTDAFTLADLEKTTALWDEAETLVRDDPRSLERVRFERKSNDSLLHYLRQRLEKRPDGTLAYTAAAFDVKPGLPYELVDDAASPNGKALRFDLDRSVSFEFSPKFRWGFMDPTGSGLSTNGVLPAAKAKDLAYTWLDLGEFTLSGQPSDFVGKYNHYFYLESEWGPHLRIVDCESQGKTFRARALVRRTGAKFDRMDMRPNELFVAAMEFVPVAGKKPEGK